MVVKSQEKPLPLPLPSLFVFMYLNLVTWVNKDASYKSLNWQLFHLRIVTQFLDFLNLLKTLTLLLLKMCMFLIPKSEKKTFDIDVNCKFKDVWVLKMPWTYPIFNEVVMVIFIKYCVCFKIEKKKGFGG